ncbi:bacillithiol biosynthesis cysteine-adding enzyme BshC [Edaphobacillus lindanitolerans]|uniref:Putative cysteine ligase BshC n=1 Tax=Edaphobacillus lindanitolerans TaxID=550447 RepID=A0A1U7PLM0_9BACI|nr:bacillithiol biosynthesis cysteine-adding enzyme BshC [Edaphobacillus lindanitolerans]SIT67879.1 bacillithiol biosynthesis cysteine-adding enzyme BshC [Edaphobacillus lindanitolerans]
MEIECLDIPTASPVMKAYAGDGEFINTYFDYPLSDDGYRQRLLELETREYDRESLADAIRAFMEPLGISDRTSGHLEELRQGAQVVIGGQQAGILSGPLYSLNKAITVILEAGRLRELLDVPVVPVFWIAGEDHDLAEINHVHAITGGRPAKRQFPMIPGLKTMASTTGFDKEEMRQFIRGIFRDYGETAHSAGLLRLAEECMEGNETFTAFFAAIVNRLLGEEGLLLVDAADPRIRRLERSHFAEMIRCSEEIATGVAESERLFSGQGYGSPVNAEEEAAHLFYVRDGERILLMRDGDRFFNEQAGVSFKTDELLGLAESSPECLSNNVVTRPLMQDLIFPVLAFVGGPGEIAYWSLLRPAFRALGIRMPVVVPRSSFTFVSRRAACLLQETGLTAEAVLQGAVGEERTEFLGKIHGHGAEEEIDHLEEQLAAGYAGLSRLLEGKGRGLAALSETNMEYHRRQFDWLKNQIHDSLLLEHETTLARFDLLEAELLPEGGFQERKYTPFQFMNEYGPGLFRDLLGSVPEQAGVHLLIRL